MFKSHVKAGLIWLGPFYAPSAGKIGNLRLESKKPTKKLFYLE